MTATATPATQAISEWVKIFPRQATENYTSSVTFMKQLTVVAVSTITYLKNAFPEDNYTVETFGGVKLRILKKKCRNEIAHFLSTALTQAFEAFEKKFLHQLALCFYEDECKLENLIEYHIFEYSYNDDGVTMNVHSKNRDNVKHTMKYTFENVRERTIHLIRACVVIMQSSQNDLPSSYDVSLRLYYNQDAPEDYQAPGFLCSDELEDHLQDSSADAFKLGWVETPHHKLIVRSYIREHFGASREAIVAINIIDCIIPSQSRPVLSNEIQLSAGGSGGSPEVVCPCNKPLEHAQRALLLLCRYCNTYQHASCFGVLRDDVQRVAEHCCALCHDRDSNRRPTDQKLVALTSKKRECLCIFRRTLEWCSLVPAVDPGSLTQEFHISPANADKLMKLLHSHGVVARDDTETNSSQTILSEPLKAVMAKFFNYRNENIVDRLLAETFQEPAPDPLGDLIPPLREVTLHQLSLGAQGPPGTPGTPGPPETPGTPGPPAHRGPASHSTGTHEPTGLDADKKCTKRKMTDGEKTPLRRGVRTKRARAMPE